MTNDQIELAKALGIVRYLPASSEKRFGRDMARTAEHHPDFPISDAQDRYMRLLAWKFRRQLPAKLVPPEKPA